MKKLYLILLISFFAISVFAQPTITTQPAVAPEVCEGGGLSLFVVATGTGTLSYQWQVYYSLPSPQFYDITGFIQTFLADQGIILVGTTSSTISATNITPDFDQLRLRCVVTDDNDSTHSGEALLNVNPKPVVNNQFDTLCENASGSGVADVDLSFYEAAIYFGIPTSLDWFADSAMTTPVVDPANVVVSNGDDYWALVNDGICTNLASVVFTVNGLVSSNDLALLICEDILGSGVATGVNLTQNESSINNNPSYTISWFTDNLFTSPVADSSNVTVNNNDVFYALISGGLCDASATVAYTVSGTIASLDQNISVCEDKFGSGQAVINLQDMDMSVNVGTGNQVDWYSDASRTLLVSNPNTITVSTDTTLFYARVISGNCSSDAQAKVTLNAQPDVRVDTSASILVGCEPTDITIIPSLSAGPELIKYKYRLTKDNDTILNIDDTNPLIILSSFGSMQIDTAGEYVLAIEDRSTGCIRKDSNDVLIQYAFENEKISLVTYDLTLGKNIVVWNKTDSVGTDSFKIFTGTGTPQSIGSVNFNSKTVFVDPSIPNVPFQYSLEVIDTCGHNSMLSNTHQTMLMTIDTTSGIALSWNDYAGFVYDKFYIHRGSDPLTIDSSIYIIDSVNNTIATNNLWTDPAPLIGDTTVYYMISVKLPNIVNILGTKKSSSGPFSRSLSNLEDNRQQSSNILNKLVNTSLSVFPNPFSSVTNISYSLSEKSNVNISIYNIIGEKTGVILNHQQNAGLYQIQLNSNDFGLNSGLYFIHFNVNGKQKVEKLILSN